MCILTEVSMVANKINYRDVNLKNVVEEAMDNII